MKVLVTGANGLIGRHLVEALARSHLVEAILRPGTPTGHSKVRWIAADLRDRKFVSTLPTSGVDSIVHLAQSRRFREFPEGAQDVVEINLDSTSALLDWCVRTGVRRFILASSGGIYGYGRDPFSEEQPIFSPGRLGHYLASKYCAELLAETYSDYMTVVILRFFFVYGAGQHPDMLIPRLVRSISTGRSIRLQGKNGLYLNPAHVDDAVAAICAALDLEQGHKINVGGPEILSLREIADLIGVKIGHRPCYSVNADAKPRNLIADVGKMGRLLSMPRVRFADGCEDVIRDISLGTNGELPSPVFRKY